MKLHKYFSASVDTIFDQGYNCSTMTNQGFNYRIVISLMRWITRIAGSLLFLLMFLILIGSLFSEDKSANIPLTIYDMVMFIGMFSMNAGFVIGWFRELIASILIIGGYLVFTLTHLIESGRYVSGWVFTTFVIVGLAYMLVWYLDGKNVKEGNNE